MFSKTFKYGLRAAVLLASAPDGEYVKVRDLSEQLGIPRSMLAKTLHVLGSAGVIETLRGPSGGCRWNSDSDQLTLADLARLLDGEAEREPCFLGLTHQPEHECLLNGLTPSAVFRAMESISVRDAAMAHSISRQTTRKS